MRRLLGLLKKFNFVIVFILLETVAMVFLSNNNAYQHSKFFNFSREISGRIYEKATGAKEYLSLKKTNEALAKENALLRNRLEHFELAPDTVPINYTKTKYFYTPSRILHGTRHKQYNFLTINKGQKEGLKADMAVIGPEGIVGIVLESSANFSTIIPIINRDFRASVKTKKDNYVGILQWDGKSVYTAQLNEIPFHAEIELGDSIVTSGYSAIFPAGLFVGTISAFSLEDGNFFDIDIQLGTDFSKLFYVNVINNFRQDEQRTLEEEREK